MGMEMDLISGFEMLRLYWKFVDELEATKQRETAVENREVVGAILAGRWHNDGR